MRALVDDSAILSSPFFARIRQASEERDLLLRWALQDRYTSYVFPQLIALILGGLDGLTLQICEVRIPIAENLWEELGEGDSRLAHSALMDDLLMSLGVPRAKMIATLLPATQRMLTAQLDLCRSDPIAGLGAFCYGNEYLALSEYDPIKRAIASAFPGADLRFFDANHEADGRHTRYLEIALDRLCCDEASRLRCQNGLEISLLVRLDFYNALCSL